MHSSTPREPWAQAFLFCRYEETLWSTVFTERGAASDLVAFEELGRRYPEAAANATFGPLTASAKRAWEQLQSDELDELIAEAEQQRSNE
jgi:hypothetical protein